MTLCLSYKPRRNAYLNEEKSVGGVYVWDVQFKCDLSLRCQDLSGVKSGRCFEN